MTPLTDFERGVLAGMPPSRIFRDQSKYGSDIIPSPGGPNPPESARYGWKLTGGDSAIIDCAGENFKYVMRFRDMPGATSLCIGLTAIGRASYYSESKKKFDPTGGAIMYDAASGIKYIRKLLANGGITFPKASYVGLDANKDGVGGGGDTGDTRNVDRVYGYDWDVRDYKEILDGKNDTRLEKAVLQNGYRILRHWGGVIGEYVRCKIYLGNGRHFIWLSGTASRAEFYDCEFYLGTEANPGRMWTKAQDIQSQYLSYDKGATRAQIIDLDAPPAWLDEPFWAQARALGDTADPPAPTPPVDPPPSPPDDLAAIIGEVALLAGALAALESRVSDLEAVDPGYIPTPPDSRLEQIEADVAAIRAHFV